MSPTQQLLGHAGTLCVGVALLGLILRRRWRLWYAFALLLLVVTLHDGLVALRRDVFYKSDIWRAKETALILIRLGMALEITWRVFARFPGALATARRMLMLIVVSTFMAVFALPVGEDGHAGFVGEMMPRILNGTIWMFAGLALLILWYRLPVHWFRKAVLLSYVPYLLVFTVAMNALGDLGWQGARWIDTLNQGAYVVLTVYWVYTAWRPEPRQRALAGPPPAA